MVYLFAIVTCIIFIEFIIRLKIINHALKIYTNTKEAVKVITSDLSDDDKERLIKKSSLNIFSKTFWLVFSFFFIGLVLFGVYYLSILIFPLLEESIQSVFVSPLMLVLLTLFSILYINIRNVISEKL